MSREKRSVCESKELAQAKIGSIFEKEILTCASRSFNRKAIARIKKNVCI
jgi:hypothetical protein